MLNALRGCRCFLLPLPRALARCGTRRYRRALVAVAFATRFVLVCLHWAAYRRAHQPGCWGLRLARGWPRAVLPLPLPLPLPLLLLLPGVVLAPWRAGPSRRSRRANLQCSLAFILTDGKARRALVAFTSRLGALALPLGGGALVAFALAPWRAGTSGRSRPAHFYPCIHLAPWRAGSYAPLQAHTVAWSSCGVGARHNASSANPLGRVGGSPPERLPHRTKRSVVNAATLRNCVLC